jgi:hypothetical protein
MSSKLITFFGSGVATFVWGKLIISLDVSAPPQRSSLVWSILVSIVVAGIFVVVEFTLKRPDQDKFIWAVVDIGLVSFVGSFTTFFLLYLILTIAGYSGIGDILHDLFSILFLGLLLFCSSFAFTLLLRIIVYFLGQANEQN